MHACPKRRSIGAHKSMRFPLRRTRHSIASPACVDCQEACRLAVRTHPLGHCGKVVETAGTLETLRDFRLGWSCPISRVEGVIRRGGNATRRRACPSSPFPRNDTFCGVSGQVEWGPLQQGGKGGRVSQEAPNLSLLPGRTTNDALIFNSHHSPAEQTPLYNINIKSTSYTSSKVSAGFAML